MTRNGRWELVPPGTYVGRPRSRRTFQDGENADDLRRIGAAIKEAFDEVDACTIMGELNRLRVHTHLRSSLIKEGGSKTFGLNSNVRFDLWIEGWMYECVPFSSDETRARASELGPRLHAAFLLLI